MYLLSEKTKNNILQTIGLTVDQIFDMDCEQIDIHISKMHNHKIEKYILDDRLVARGQSYSYRKRFINMEEVDRKLKKNDRRKSPFIRKPLPTIQKSN